MPETMKLLKGTKSKKIKYENGETVPCLEISEVVLLNCNIVNNNYQQNSKVLWAFVTNKSFGQLLDISPKKFIILKTFYSELSYIELWCPDQNSKPLEIEDKINITLVNYVKCKMQKIMCYSVQPRDQIFVSGCGFLSFAKNMGKSIGKNISKNLSGKYSQESLDNAKQSVTDGFKTASRREFQKTAEATGDLIVKKLLTKFWKFQKIHNKIIQK